MSVPSDRPDRTTPDDALPPVEAPSAGFILQLFVVPAVIVTIIIGIWMAINWLAHMGSDPQSYVEALHRNNEARWQAAVNLADALRNPNNAQLKHDHKTAQELAAVLDEQLASGGTSENDIKLRVYLCSALGSFQVPEVVEPLERAIRSQQNVEKSQVRLWALIGLTVHMNETKDFDLAAHPQLAELLLEQSKDAEPLIRSTAAFALGELSAHDNEPARERLQGMLSDPYPDVRFNAATMLARVGGDESTSVLVEMLDPEESRSLKLEEDDAQASKHQDVMLNALRATRELVAKNPRVDVTHLRAAVDKLRATDMTAPVSLSSAETLQALDAAPGASR